MEFDLRGLRGCETVHYLQIIEMKLKIEVLESNNQKNNKTFHLFVNTFGYYSVNLIHINLLYISLICDFSM